MAEPDLGLKPLLAEPQPDLKPQPDLGDLGLRVGPATEARQVGPATEASGASEAPLAGAEARNAGAAPSGDAYAKLLVSVRVRVSQG